MKHPDLSLYLVTDRDLTLSRPLEMIVEEAVRGGVTIVQLREKKADSREFYHLALNLKKLLHTYGVPLIINDRLDIALAMDADGIHLGQSDLPADVVRRFLGPDKIIGLSVESMQDVVHANMSDIDYIAVSPVFSTPTKTDTKKPFGIKGVGEVADISKFPMVGIGGINEVNAGEIIKQGASGIAVVSAIMSAGSPYHAALKLKEIVVKSLKDEA